MEVQFTPEVESMLMQTATLQGRLPGELVQELIASYFEEEGRFVEAVKQGEEALRRGEFLTHEEMNVRLDRYLRP